MVLEIAAAVVMAAVHALSPYLSFLDRLPRSRWLSAAGGVSLAYVFVLLLPELAARQREAFEGEAALVGAETELFLVALVGLLVFYGLERLVTRHRGGKTGKAEAATTAVFWIHIASFALYNALIGYLLVRSEERGLAELAAYVFAMGVHFVVNDRGLSMHHQRSYLQVGRWVVAAAVIAGLIIGLARALPELAVVSLFAFLAGGVVLNVMKEELPQERESSFGALVLGAGVYAVILHFV